MKSAIIYYSYSGNTRKVAQVLSGLLRKTGETTELELIALDESKSFFSQCRRAFHHVDAQIQAVESDLSKYDLVCLGSPVWAFGPAPAMNAFLHKCSGIKDKKVILFTTYGSGTGNGRALNYMRAILSKKGAADFWKFSFPQSRCQDKEFIENTIQAVLGSGF